MDDEMAGPGPEARMDS